MSTLLFESLEMGRFRTRNRIFFSACTRNRARVDQTPTPMMAEYYAQRASAGLIVTEGISPSDDGAGYVFTPGLCTDAQEAAWVPVIRAVHERGGRIFAQLMHVGRLAHEVMLPEQRRPVGPSEVVPDPDFRGYLFTGPVPRDEFQPPIALSKAGIHRILSDYVEAAQRAVSAGFDGVEVHGGSGYLPHQFLCSNTNQRPDEYGGSPERRARFVLELMNAIAGSIGPERVALKLSPGFQFNDVRDEDPEAVYLNLLDGMRGTPFAYIQVSQFGDFYGYDQVVDWLDLARSVWDGNIIANGGLNRDSAESLIHSGRADGAAFGVPFIANPDLPSRFLTGQPLNEPDPSTYYTQGRSGYTDYPTVGESGDVVSAGQSLEGVDLTSRYQAARGAV